MDAVVALVAAVSLGLASFAEAQSGVPASRLDRLSKGANVCRWFRFPPNTGEEHLTGYITDDEMAAMRRMGLRHVRFCVGPTVVMDEATGTIKEREWKLYEAAIDRFIKHDLAVMVDPHNENRQGIENDPNWRKSFARFWSEIAKRLSTRNPDMLFLELVNEPVFDGKEQSWFDYQEQLVKIVRTSAPRHTIVCTGPNWGGIDGLLKAKPVADRNVVYSFHCYDPFPFTHQGATWSSNNVKPLRAVPYPSSPEAVLPLLEGLPDDAKSLLRQYGEERWDRKRLAARFGQAIEWGKKHNVPLYCGEFGVFPPYTKPEHRAAWFKDFGDILSENKVGWAVWGWDEGFGLSRSKEGGVLKVDPVVARSLGLGLP